MMQSSSKNENDGSEGADKPSPSIVVEVRRDDGPAPRSRLTPELNSPVSASKDENEGADVAVEKPCNAVEAATRNHSADTTNKHLALTATEIAPSKDENKGSGLSSDRGENEGAHLLGKASAPTSAIVVAEKVDHSPTTKLLLAPKSNKTEAKNPGTTAATSAATSTSCSTPLRRGKWTPEEETYVARIIQEFNSGYLNAPAGTTLRTYLSKKLHCDPMRITKKFQGELAIGKRVFHPAVRCENNSSAIDRARTELESLERRWRKRLEMQQQQSAKRASAASRSAASSSIRRAQSLDSSARAQSSSNEGHPSHPNQYQHKTVAKSSSFTHEAEPSPTLSTCLQTTSWLERAQALLDRKPATSVMDSTNSHSRRGTKASSSADEPSINSSRQQESKEKEPKTSTTRGSNAVANRSCRKVSTESASQENTSCPISEQTTAEKRPRRSQSVNSLSSMSSNEDKDAEERSRLEGRARSQSTGHDPSSPQRRESLAHSISRKASKCRQDKKMRKSQSMNSLSLYSSPEAEDAEALVGFLNTVRAAAAAGGGNM